MKKIFFVLFIFLSLFAFAQQQTSGGYVGTPGITGPTGITGATGSQGATGATGNVGNLTGDVVSVGNATTLNTGTNVTLTTPILNGQVVVIKPSGTWTWYNASANTDAARGTILATAFSAMAYGDAIIVGPGNYLVTATLTILGKTNIQFRGSRLYTTDKTLKMFSSVGKNDWSMTGGCFEGANNSSSPTDYGIRIDSCFNYRLSNMKFSKFMQIGMEVYGSSLATTRISGQFSNIASDSCGTGIRIENYAEYNEWSNVTAAYNVTNFICASGNNRFSNCNFLNASNTGAWMKAGGNDSHCSFSSCSFNHNSTYNLRVGAGVPSNFTGCDFYANDNSSGYIDLDTTGAVNITGGTLASSINTRGTLTNLSKFSDMRVPSTFTVTVTNGVAANRLFLLGTNIVADNKAQGNIPVDLSTSGTYTPSISAQVNIAASTLSKAQYSRVGNVVTVSGQLIFSLTSGSANTTSSFQLSLPIASDIVLIGDCAGTCNSARNGQAQNWQILGSTANDTAQFETYNQTSTGSANYSYQFTYYLQ